MLLIQDRMELFGAEITVLSVLSVTALVTTISLFFCGMYGDSSNCHPPPSDRSNSFSNYIF
jgi:hypothetical protein